MDLDTNQNSQCKEKNIDVGEQPVRVENTAILECLEVVMSEYKIERDKKQSFEKFLLQHVSFLKNAKNN